MTRPASRFLSLLPPAILLLLPCLLLWRVVFLGEAFVPADFLRDVAPWRTGNPHDLIPWNPLMWDGIAEFYPWRAFAATSIHQGYIPLWNPHQFCGTPFLANSQSAVLYPLNVLFYLLPVPTAFGASVLLHLFLTGLFFFGFLRSNTLRLRPAAALLGAVVWQLSSWQVSWLALPTFLCVSAWLPLALLLSDRWISRPSVERAAALGACLGVMLLAGHLQIALYCFLLVAVYALFRAIPLIRQTPPLSWRLLGGAALAVGLMVCLAAPQLLPAVELSRVSHRAGGSPTWDSYGGYVRLALPAINLVTVFLPGFFGNPAQGTYWGIGINGGPSAYMENACYVGILALLLATLGIGLTWRQHPQTRFFALAALVSLLLALGTPLNAALYFGIPGFAQSGSPGRILVLWAFCAATLAAIGADALLSQPLRFDKAMLRAVAAFTLVGLLAFGYAAFWIGRHAPAGTLSANLGTESDLWRLSAGILFGAAALLWLRQRGTLTTRALGRLLAALAAVDLLATGIGYNRTAPSAKIYPVTPAIAYLQQNAGYERVMPINRRWTLSSRPPPAVLPPNAATVYGLYDTQGYDSLQTGQYFQFANALNGGRGAAPVENGNLVFTNDWHSLQAQSAAARYVVSLGALPADDPNLVLRVQDGETFVYENPTVLPRARVQHGTATITRQTPTRISITVSGNSASLQIADQWYPGWQAWVNGRRAAILAAPDVFRTIPLEEATENGSARVEMRYLPTTFRVGLYLGCLALAVISAVAARGTLARRLRRIGERLPG